MNGFDMLMEAVDDFLTATPSVEMMRFHQKRLREAALAVMDDEKALVDQFVEDSD